LLKFNFCEFDIFPNLTLPLCQVHFETKCYVHKTLQFFYCPKLVDAHVWILGCTHSIDGLFWSVSIYYLLGFFLKYECWVTNLIMPLYQIFFWGCHLPFCITRFHITMKCKKQFIWLIFKMNVF
jgi:hypothetical protein